jgi:hypothetical protein
MRYKQGSRRRLIVSVVILASGLLGAGLFAVGYGGPSVARGTSEALGYPTNTPAATQIPISVPPTGTATAILPTSTASPILPSATPVPPTTTPSVTVTPTPAKAPVTLQLSAKSLQRGDQLTIQVRTLPGLAIKGVVRYPSLGVRTVLTAHSDPRGMATLRIAVAQSPAQGTSSLGGLVQVTASGTGRLGSVTAGFTVYQSVHLSVSANVVSQHGARRLLVSVGVAKAAAINVSVLLSRGGQGAIVAHGQAAGKGKVTIQVTLPKVSDSATAHITVMIVTREGVRETSKLAVAVIA